MRNFKIITMSAALLLAFVGTVVGQANQSVTVDVDAINEISVSGDPASLVIDAATAGSQPDDASDNSTSYNITTNESNRKIVGSLSADYPANVTLKVTLASAGATSAGQKTLSLATPQDLVTGISNLAESSQVITYVASATVAASPGSAESRTVTLTIAAGA
ncbi:MAG TPA: hypothetical protein VJB15_06840 [Rhodothermia bacterium]|nr:hypothetical protein [Rhodothermia bacterium]